MWKKDVPGVYTLTNTISGRVYVGRSLAMYRRWSHHRAALNKGTHQNRYLQRAWTGYGADAFVFAIWADLRDVPREELDIRLHKAECAALETFPRTYNLAELVQEGNHRQSIETRALIQAKSKEMWADEDRREMAALRMIARNAKNWRDPAYRAARLADHAARLTDPAYRAAHAKGVAASWAKPEIHAKKVAALRKASATAKVKANRGAAQKRRWADPEQYAKQKELMAQLATSPEYRAISAKRTAELWADPEHRAKRIAALRAGWAKKRAART